MIRRSIKLPQEYFIHIAQIDLTDDFAGLFEAQPWLMAGGLVAAFVIVFLVVVGGWGGGEEAFAAV